MCTCIVDASKITDEPSLKSPTRRGKIKSATPEEVFTGFLPSSAFVAALFSGCFLAPAGFHRFTPEFSPSRGGLPSLSCRFVHSTLLSALRAVYCWWLCGLSYLTAYHYLLVASHLWTELAAIKGATGRGCSAERAGSSDVRRRIASVGRASEPGVR